MAKLKPGDKVITRWDVIKRWEDGTVTLTHPRAKAPWTLSEGSIPDEDVIPRSAKAAEPDMPANLLEARRRPRKPKEWPMSRWQLKADGQIVDAFLWTGGIGQTEDPFWMKLALRQGKARIVNKGTPDVSMIIKTASGTEIEAILGKWIVRDDCGEIFPCQPEVFDVTYGPAS